MAKFIFMYRHDDPEIVEFTPDAMRLVQELSRELGKNEAETLEEITGVKKVLAGRTARETKRSFAQEVQEKRPDLYKKVAQRSNTSITDGLI